MRSQHEYQEKYELPQSSIASLAMLKVQAFGCADMPGAKPNHVVQSVLSRLLEPEVDSCQQIPII